MASDTTAVAAAPRRQRLTLRTSLGRGGELFGLRPESRLPVVIAGAPFFLSGVKRPGRPWELRLRGRFPVDP